MFTTTAIERLRGHYDAIKKQYHKRDLVCGIQKPYNAPPKRNSFVFAINGDNFQLIELFYCKIFACIYAYTQSAIYNSSNRMIFMLQPATYS